MINKELGEKIDIHGGGKDLRFPHHENERAQSMLLKNSELANYWMHSGMIDIDGVKMSKSLGNFITAKDILRKVDPMVLRWFLLGTHYRADVSVSDEIIEAAVGITRTKGIDAVTAREVGRVLGVSSRPLFTYFDTVEELKRAVYLYAKELYKGYVKDGLKAEIPFLGVGQQYLRFAKEEPNLYKYLFLTPPDGVRGGFSLRRQRPSWRHCVRHRWWHPAMHSRHCSRCICFPCQ